MDANCHKTLRRNTQARGGSINTEDKETTVRIKRQKKNKTKKTRTMAS